MAYLRRHPAITGYARRVLPSFLAGGLAKDIDQGLFYGSSSDVSASVSWTDTGDTVSIAGSSEVPPISANVSWTDTGDSVEIVGEIPISAQIYIVDEGDVLSITGTSTLNLSATVSWTDQSDSFHIVGTGGQSPSASRSHKNKLR